MASPSKRIVLAFTSLAVMWAVGSFAPSRGARLAAQGAAASAKGAPKQQMAEDVYKNVQVLKGIPVDEFIGTMGVFTTSLTLCCGNCHTGAGTEHPAWE